MSSRSATRRTMDIKQIMETLPHRYPLLLVDRILDLSPGEFAVGLKAVTINETFFQGHFPGHPVMPAVLITESMAQVGGVLMATSSGSEGKIAYFGGIDRQKFRKPVVPGDLLVTRVEMIATKGRIGKVRAAAYIFRLDTSNLEASLENPTVASLPPNNIACLISPGEKEGQPDRKMLLGCMEGELAAEGEMLFALVNPNQEDEH